MKKITLTDFEKNHKTKTKGWLNCLSICMTLLLGSFTLVYGQGSTCGEPISVSTIPYTHSSETQTYGNAYAGSDRPPLTGASYTNGSGTATYLAGYDAVYSITPTVNGTISINTTNTAGWVSLWVFTGCPFSGTAAYHTATTGTTRSIPNLNVVANTTYYIVISNWDPINVVYTLNITGSEGLLTPLVECSGTPDGGTAILTPNTTNAGSTFTAKTTGTTIGLGLTYQWQKSVNDTWIDIPGATTITSEITAENGAVGTVTNYRLAVTCIASAQTSYSTPAALTISLVYCTPTLSANNNDEIRNFTLNNLNNSSTASEGIGGYSNYAGIVAPAQLQLNVGYIATVTAGTGTGTHGAAIWIDYNQNGTFEDTEKVSHITNSIGANATASFPEFIIPEGTPLGIYRLRVQYQYNKNGIDLLPCAAFSEYSETEDYNVEVLSAPTCLQPSGLSVTNLTYNSADLVWNSNGTNYSIEWGIQGFTPGTGTTVNNVTAPYSLSNLTSTTSYSFYVRQDCGAEDGLSLWTGPYTFKTLCGPISTLNENFDSYTATGSTNPLPTCWTRFGNTGSSYITTGAAAPMTPANRLYLSGSETGATFGVAVMPPFGNLQDETHRLKFKAYSTTANKSLEVGYYEIADDASSFVVLEEFEMPSTALASTQDFTYVPQFIPAGVYSLAFRVNGGAFTGTTTIYIDDVIWEEIPSCDDITEIEISNITHSTADILWNYGGGETAWEYVYAVSTVTDPATLTPQSVSNNPFLSLTELLPNTNYKLWIRSDCGNGSVGNWSVAMTFKTACAPTEFFTENFDAMPTGSVLPNCWSKGGNGTVTINSGSVAPSSPANRLYMFANGTATTPTTALAILPPVSNLSAGTHRLKFRGYASTTNKHIEIGYLADATDLTTYVELETIPFTTTTAATAKNYTFIPENVPAGVTTLVLKNTGLPASTIVYLDDITWEPQPLCPDVETLVFGSVTNTSATFSWIPGDSETAWEYVYALATETNPNTLTPITVTGSPETTITNLEAATAYKVWVRSTCGTNLGAFSAPLTFTTACNAITTLPWTEGFENITAVGTTAFPPCWFKQNGDWATAIDQVYNTPRTGTNYIRNSWSASNEFMWTPGFELTAGTSYDFSFFMQSDGYTGWNIDVFQNTVQNSAGATQIGETVVGSGTGTLTMQPYVYVYNTFVPETSGTYYFAIRVNQASGAPYYVAFDDFKLDLSPACIQPAITAPTSITYESAVINWNAPSSAVANGYEYFVTTDAALVPNTNTAATGSVGAGVTTATLENLTPTTTYKYFVRSICSDTDTSDWSSAGTFTTACAPITSLPWNEGFESLTTVGTSAFPACWFKQNGDWSSASTSSGTYNTPRTGTKYIRNAYSSTNEFMWTPGFELTAGTSYDFGFFMQGDGFTGWNVDLFYSNSQNSTNATQLGATAIPFGTGSAATQPYTLVNNTFVPTTSGIYYFAVRVNQPSSSPYFVAFDDFSLDLTPSCIAPTVTAATNVTTTTATINWLASSTVAANGYEYFVTTSTELPNANTIPTGNTGAGVNSMSLTDLDSSTIYKYYVKAICSDSDSSAWSQAGTFTTLCDVASLPYTINFETATVPALPVCTSNQNVGTGNNWITANNPGSGFTNKTLRYTYNSANAANAWFYTNLVNLTAGNQYTISYKFGTNSTSYVEKFKIAFGDAAVNTSMTNEIINHPSVTGNSPQTNTATFSPTVSGLYYIGFNVYSASNQNALFIDDIVIQEALGKVDFNTNSFKVYPNPVKNNLTIRYTENISSATIYNILGQELFVKNINHTEGQIDMSNLAAGTYLVKVKSGEKVETIKVIKE